MISVRNYFTICILFIIVFVLFMFAAISSDILADPSANSQSGEEIVLRANDTLSSAQLNEETPGSIFSASPANPRAAIIAPKGESTAEIISEWCVYSKYTYRLFESLPDTETASRYDVLLFAGDAAGSGDIQTLLSYADAGIPMIFTKLPDYETLQANADLADFFGIRETVDPAFHLDGMKLFADFLLSGERVYERDDFYGETDDFSIALPYYKLRPGYEVYAVGILYDQAEQGIANEDMPPVVWRTVTGNAFVFTVNGDMFDGSSLIGLITSFMAQTADCYLYPIVNAQTFSVLNFPYLSSENSGTAQEIYSRPSDSLSRDILWPNIVQIFRSYGAAYNSFASPELDYSDGDPPSSSNVGFYLRAVSKLPGAMGISLDQVSAVPLNELIGQNAQFLKNALASYRFTALYTGSFDPNEIVPYLDGEPLRDVSLVLSGAGDGETLMRFLNDDVLSVRFTLDGFVHEAMDDLKMCCLETSLGLCNEQVNLKNVFFPKDEAEEWNAMSVAWSSGKTYFKDFSAFDKTTVYEMETRARRFLALNYTYRREGDFLNISIGNFQKEAYFILRVHTASVQSVVNGTAEQISPSAYLITATSDTVLIRLKERNTLGMPE